MACPVGLLSPWRRRGPTILSTSMCPLRASGLTGVEGIVGPRRRHGENASLMTAIFTEIQDSFQKTRDEARRKNDALGTMLIVN